MPVTNIGTLREVVLGGASPVYLVQCTQRSIDPGTGLVMNRAAGQPEISWVSVMDLRPQIGFSTTEIGRMLGVIDYQAGLAIGSGLAKTSADFYFNMAQDLGLYKTSTNHTKVATTRGLFIPGELSASQGGEATMSATYYSTTSDGTSNPWTITTNSAVSAATMTVDQKYTLGKATINGTQVNGLIGSSVSFGCEYEILASDGAPYATYCRIKTNNPVIKLQTNDPNNLSLFGVEGTAIISSSDVYYTALASNGTRVANGTTSHIKIQTSTGLATVGAVSGSNGEAHGCEITITPTKVGSTYLTISAASAIS